MERVLTRSESVRHRTELTHIVSEFMRGEATVQNFKDWCARCIREDRPVHPQVLVAPDIVVETEIRHLVLACPWMSRYHGDARAWLKERNHGRDVKEGVVGWNMICGGQDIESDQAKFEDQPDAADPVTGQKRDYVTLYRDQVFKR